jgi:tight adherence protein C
MSGTLVGLGAVVAYGIALVGLRMTRDAGVAARRLDAGLRPRAGRAAGGTGLRVRIGRRGAPLVLRALGDRGRRRLDHHLAAAGRPDRMALADVAALKAADTVTCAVIGVGAITISPLLLPLVTAYGYVRQDLRLRGLARTRQARIERDLPDYLDVLAVTIGAGLKFRAALQRVGEHVDSPVADEFRIALQQLEVGASRRDAFQGIRDRNDSPSLNRFVGALLQAEELGTPLTDAMAAIATDVRRAVAQRVRRQAAQAVPKVTLVATVLLMPASALLLIGGLVIGSGIDLGGVLGG